MYIKEKMIHIIRKIIHNVEKGKGMKIEFISNAFEHLKTAYYEDFFFQDVEVRDLENDRVLLASDFQGKFLQLIWDVLIEFESQNTVKKVKQYGKKNFYLFERVDNHICIELNGERFVDEDYAIFHEAYYEATKHYLQFIRRENPRVALQESFQQLAASCSYFERRF